MPMTRVKTVPALDADGNQIGVEVVREELSSTEETSVQAEWDANVPPIYARLIEQIKNEGLRRIQAIYPAVGSMDDLDLLIDLFTSIDASARQSPKPGIASVIAIIVAAKSAIANVKTFTTQAEVDGYDVTTDPGW
jgi:hypothetical protein